MYKTTSSNRIKIKQNALMASLFPISKINIDFNKNTK